MKKASGIQDERGVTAVLGAMGSNVAGKRLAGAHMIFNLTVGTIAILFIAPLADDLAYLGRTLAARGWLPIYRQELDELLLHGPLEFLAAVADQPPLADWLTEDLPHGPRTIMPEWRRHSNGICALSCSAIGSRPSTVLKVPQAPPCTCLRKPESLPHDRQPSSTVMVRPEASVKPEMSSALPKPCSETRAPR